MVETVLEGDPLVLIGTNQIAKERWFPYTEETARRYFRKNIFYTHSLDSNNAQLSLRGSAFVRFAVLNKIKIEASNKKKKISLEDLGAIMSEAENLPGWGDDNFIVSKLKDSMSINDIISEVSGVIKTVAFNKQG